jgi:ABC-type transport system involved in multi-copper enzyme maturation permease subunit
MIRAILWKEWHEHRSRYISYWITLNVPIIILCLAIAFTKGARVPFADLSDANAWKYLPLALIEPIALATIFMIAAGYLAVAIFSPEIEDGSLFFIFEQPVPRKRYVAIKFLHGACHVLAATWFAGLLAPSVIYAMMLLSGKVTIAGSAAAFIAVMGAVARTTIWASLLAIVGFTASALISALVPRWWLAAAGSVLLLVLFGYLAGDFFFDFFPADSGEPMSVSANLTTGGAQWITISRAVKPVELAGFGHWKALPLFTAALLAAGFSIATALLYDRKELK